MPVSQGALDPLDSPGPLDPLTDWLSGPRVRHSAPLYGLDMCANFQKRTTTCCINSHRYLSPKAQVCHHLDARSDTSLVRRESSAMSDRTRRASSSAAAAMLLKGKTAWTDKNLSKYEIAMRRKDNAASGSGASKKAKA